MRINDDQIFLGSTESLDEFGTEGLAGAIMGTLFMGNPLVGHFTGEMAANSGVKAKSERIIRQKLYDIKDDPVLVSYKDEETTKKMMKTYISTFRSKVSEKVKKDISIDPKYKSWLIKVNWGKTATTTNKIFEDGKNVIISHAIISNQSQTFINTIIEKIKPGLNEEEFEIYNATTDKLNKIGEEVLDEMKIDTPIPLMVIAASPEDVCLVTVPYKIDRSGNESAQTEEKIVSAILEEYGIEGVTSVIRNLTSK